MTDQPWTVIINPAAGRGRALKKWEALATELTRHGMRYKVLISEYKGHISVLAAGALTEGTTRFISVGGDGTHHELINGIMCSGPSGDKPVIGILNAGSGNDWARTFGIDGNVQKCARMLKACQTISHPAGSISISTNDTDHVRYFVNVAGMALDGRVVETYPEVFRRFSFLPGYLMAGLWQLIAYRAKHMRVSAEESELESKMLTVHAGIGRFSGGGMQFVPHADPVHQDLAITCVQSMSKLRLFANIYRLYTASLLAHPLVTSFRTCALSVSGDPVPVEADGEFIGYTPVTVSCIPDAFRLVVPTSPEARPTGSSGS